MNNKKTVILLGSEGDLGSCIVDNLQKKSIPFIAVDKYEIGTKKSSKYFCADFSKPEEVVNLSTNLFANFSQDNIIISTIGRFDDCDFVESLQTNLISIANLSLSLIEKSIVENKKIRFVLTGSAAGTVGSSNIGYGVSKAGLNGLVVSLSKKFARQGIITIGVNPGIFTSKMSQSVSQERQNFAISQTHIKCSGLPNEVADLIIYAAFEAPDFMTGTLINISGGQVC